MTNNIAPVTYWNELYNSQEISYDITQISFRSIFNRFVKPGMDCFDVGCYPGRYMVYLFREFGCSVSGIDNTNQIERMENLFSEYGVTPRIIVKDDFMNFNPTEQFDFVYSLGFVEHFINFDEVILKQISLVKKNGYLFISCPNFTNFQYLFHWVFDRKNLKRHFIPSMNLKKWESLMKQNNMEIEMSGYFGTFRVWIEDKSTSYKIRQIQKFIIQLSRNIDEHINFPNRLTSPFLVMIARKIAD